jgi:hypothetical protein
VPDVDTFMKRLEQSGEGIALERVDRVFLHLPFELCTGGIGVGV